MGESVVATAEVGSLVGADVGDFEGVPVGSAVGELVGVPVGETVGKHVGVSVGCSPGYASSCVGCGVVQKEHMLVPLLGFRYSVCNQRK